MQPVIRGQHLRPLDGLRGLAVLSVVAHHLNQRPFTGGYLGVDLFFVLSGFLITSLLIEEHGANGRIALGRFYARRAKRLFPALAACLVATAVVMVVLGHWQPENHAFLDLNAVRQAMLTSIFYVQNWLHLPIQTPVTQMWSLAVEEQFYVLWPLLVIGLVRVASRWRYFAIGTATVAGFVSFTVMDNSYSATYSRGGELLAGALLAFAIQHDEVRQWFAARARWLAPLSLSVFLVMTQTTQVGGIIHFPPPWMFQWGFAVVAIAVAALIGTTVSAPDSLVGRMLSFTPLVGLGLISYGLYLYHWLIFYFLTPESTGWDWKIVIVARVTFALVVAIVSYHYLEVPLRRARYQSWRRVLAPVGMVACVIATLVATTPRIGAPYSSPPATAAFRVDATTAGANDVTGYLNPRSAPHIRKIQIIGDVAMARIAQPFVTALAQPHGVSVLDNSNSLWGLTAAGGTTRTLEDQRQNVNLTAFGVYTNTPDLVIFSSTLGDFPTVAHDGERYRRAMERFVSLVLHVSSRPDVILVLAPQPTLEARTSDVLATSRVNAVMKHLALKWPGRVVAVGSTVITNGSVRAPMFGPPNNRPLAATSEWVRWRTPDGVSVCQPAVVRQAAMILHVLEPQIPGPYADGWWKGEWLLSPLFTGPSPCLSNHP